jgi:hypothetical protein
LDYFGVDCHQPTNLIQLWGRKFQRFSEVAFSFGQFQIQMLGSAI